MNARDEDLSREFGLRCDEARAALQRHMAEHGLRIEDGWWIHEFTRQVDGRTELVMRPAHRQLPAPTDLECVCMIDEQGSNASSECRDQ
jgi:hypothetical protein